MLHLDSDTLAYYKESPFLKKLDFTQVPVPALAEGIRVELEKTEKATPEVEALTFYLYNHAYSLVAAKVNMYEPLGAYLPVVDGYLSRAANIFRRLMHYMVLIVTRESRHLHSGKKFYESLEANFGAEFMRFHKSIHGGGSSDAVSTFFSSPPDMLLGEYLTGITTLFGEGKFSSGYGGIAWREVANVLRSMVYGETTPEMMVDLAWTLCHNNGPIYNKGMFYDSYSHELKKILDVQRSGQIPQYLDSYPNKFSSQVQGLAELQALWPDEMSGYVDWFQVEALGALGHYEKEKQAQVNKYGYPEQGPGAVSAQKIWVSETDYAEQYQRAA